MRLVRRLHFRTAWLTSAAVLLSFSSACSTKPGAPEEKPRQYSLRGVVVRLDPKSNLASIKGEKIDGWMDAMTMEYPVENRAEYQALRKDEKITATVNVTSEGFWLSNVKERKE
jgi:Cu/Ag efflux protein CusF